MPPDERDEAMDERELSRYWNAVNAGEPAPLEDIDPDLAATVCYLRVVGDRPPADDALLRQLGEHLMVSTIPARFNSNCLHAWSAEIGTASPPATTARRRPPTGVRWLRRAWPPLELVAAILLIVALGSIAL